MRSRFFLTFVFAALAAVACGPAAVGPDQANYEPAVRAFYVGIAALDAGDDRRARSELTRATELAPNEPAAWNGLGILQLRQRDLEAAKASLDRAASLAETNPVITRNLAVLAAQMGDGDASIGHLQRAIELDPSDLYSAFLLAQEYERQTKDSEALAMHSQISTAAPDNLAAGLETARLAAKTGDIEKLRAEVTRLGPLAADRIGEEAREHFDNLRTAASAGNAREAATNISYVRNVLLRESWFRNALAEFQPSDTAIGALIYKPLVLPAPEFRPADAAASLQYQIEPVAATDGNVALPFFSEPESAPIIIRSTGERITVGEIDIPAAAAGPDGFAALDLDYDFRNDIAIAGPKGIRIFHRGEGNAFDDITGGAKIPAQIVNGAFSGIWPFDVEHDGDLDLVAARETGPPVVLRNNGDLTFEISEPFAGLENVRQFLYFDIDEDGDSDAIFLTSDGVVRIFENRRGGVFRLMNSPDLRGVVAIAVGDASGASRLELVTAAGENVSTTYYDGGSRTRELLKLSDHCESDCRVFIADLDNNGAEDVLVSRTDGTDLYLRGANGAYTRHSVAISTQAIADINGDGRLDLIGVASGKPSVATANFSSTHHWQAIRTKAAKTEGDQRVNSFGIGGEIELRSGLHSQKRLITSPQVHFGLGEQTAADVLRVIWGNGYVQAEFDLEADRTIAAEQRLKGSCPHLFAWNGERFALVKDAPPWSPALGLKINAQDTYGILQTEEWFKVPGEALQPKDGFYELRITGEYWESFYLDHYRLIAVDHPEDTEIFTDERFAIPLPPLKVFSTEQRRPFASALDHKGRDVADKIAKLDEVYLDGFELGRFQGVAEDHWVEVELPSDAPRDGKLWLIGDGWVHPTDASINVQRGQGTDPPPRTLSLEIQQADGTWKTAKDNLGFPAGKLKTILIDLEGVFPAGISSRNLRLRTELEIYWDRLAWAAGLEDSTHNERPLALSSAELRYRGFSVIEKAGHSAPEIPVYDQILTTGQRWRDLEGYYTRFGDVTELLTGVDGRMVLMNAGDELILRFPELPPVRPGFRRDFVFVGNGWIKDGDLNSVFSSTLLPLPTHATNDYSNPPRRLEDDPVYRQFTADWIDFHTRYVGTDRFRNALRKPRPE
jgi:Tfp pilus assembly protein PilF